MSEVELNEPPATGGYSVTLPTFEGPLDLLLHLCQKHELDILDIPIGFVTEKYLQYLAVMQLINLDVASEYLVMAATLAHIKSKLLLPAPPPGQEDELAGEEADPREALIRRLLEYQKYKQAGEDLANRGVAGRDVFMRGMKMEEAAHTGLPPLAQVPLFSLVEAFQTVLSKSKVKLSHDIVHERVTLADRINELVDILRVKRRVAFEELFADLETRFDLVITFLALLEMTRLRMTRLFQVDFESPIYIEFTAQVTADDDAEPGASTSADEGTSDDAGEAHAGAENGAATTFDTEAPPAMEAADVAGASELVSPDEAFPRGETFSDEDDATMHDGRSPFHTEAPPRGEDTAVELHASEPMVAPMRTIPAPPPTPESSSDAAADTSAPAPDEAADDGWASVSAPPPAVEETSTGAKTFDDHVMSKLRELDAAAEQTIAAAKGAVAASEDAVVAAEEAIAAAEEAVAASEEPSADAVDPSADEASAADDQAVTTEIASEPAAAAGEEEERAGTGEHDAAASQPSTDGHASADRSEDTNVSDEATSRSGDENT